MTSDIFRPRRSYQAWVANETMEDYSLRYAAKSFRKWKSFVIVNTALGGISFLALEAIGGAIARLVRKTLLAERNSSSH